MVQCLLHPPPPCNLGTSGFFFLHCLLFSKKEWLNQIIPQSGICPAPYMLRQCTVVFAWQCRFFCFCAHVQSRICYIYHVELYFRFRHLLSFPVKHQLWRGCHGEKSSKKNIFKGRGGGGMFLRDEPIFDFIFNF